MDRVLVKLSENGQTYKTMEEWQVKEPDCKPLTNTGNPLTLEKLISLFMIVCSGILLALTVMIFELFSKCFTQNEVQLDNKDLLKFKKILEYYEVNFKDGALLSFLILCGEAIFIQVLATHCT